MVLKTFCDYDSARLKALGVRFSAPIFPGETITLDMWQDAEIISFEAKVRERGVAVIKNGRAIVAGLKAG